MCASGLADQLLVAQMQHFAGQHLVPVVHEAQIAAIVAPQILQVVAEGLAFGEMLLVGAEAGVHRVAAHIDDDRPRQNGVDQAHVAEIVRHLVDEVRPSAAQRGGLLDVAPAERRDASGGCGAHDFRIGVVRRDWRGRTPARW